MLFKFLKKIALGFALLYGYNFIAVNFNMVIPINLYTILFTVVLDFPGLVGLILFKMFIL